MIITNAALLLQYSLIVSTENAGQANDAVPKVVFS